MSEQPAKLCRKEQIKRKEREIELLELEVIRSGHHRSYTQKLHIAREQLALLKNPPPRPK